VFVVPKRSQREFDWGEPTKPFSLPAAAVFSFLKEMSGETNWTLGDMARSLKISATEGKHIAAIFELQGYIKREGKDTWITTLSGEEVSGAQMPRFKPDHVEEALENLRKRIEVVNQARSSEYRVTQAVAFGDFVRKPTRAQAADVGTALEPRNLGTGTSPKRFLAALKARTAALNIVPFEPWMAARRHKRLI
jgi:hypothetical protein